MICNISTRKLLIGATYFFAFVAVLQIFYHENGREDDWRSSYRKKLLRGTNFLRNRISALQEKAKDIIHEFRSDDDDMISSSFNSTDDKMDDGDDYATQHLLQGRSEEEIDALFSGKENMINPDSAQDKDEEELVEMPGNPEELSKEAQEYIELKENEILHPEGDEKKQEVKKEMKVFDNESVDDDMDDIMHDDEEELDASLVNFPVKEASKEWIRTEKLKLVKQIDEDDGDKDGQVQGFVYDDVISAALSGSEDDLEDDIVDDINAVDAQGADDSLELEFIDTVNEDKSRNQTSASINSNSSHVKETVNSRPQEEPEKRGLLQCNGSYVDSEVIYWRIVPGDITYESPITPHHGEHHDRYLSFTYDAGGWNNIRMGLECMIVMAHAMGRTLIVPPQDHLYLLTAQHKDHPLAADSHDEMQFEDFFDLDLLKSHQGFHMMSMQEFLLKEGCSGGLHGVLPPKNDSALWGAALWAYLDKVADATPEWSGRKYFALPDRPGDFNLSAQHHPKFNERVKAFRGQGFNDREAVYYDEKLQKAHHIHFPSEDDHRILQHHYAFVFFASPVMTSFYRRFVRDFMRYKDPIQCAGAELVAAVRKDSLKANPHGKGEYYALHIRRGDFQYKEMKIGTPEILKNLHFPDGTPVIPPGSLVYISTDDPDGVCARCTSEVKPCTQESTNPRPPGCPEDSSWNAFIKAGWKIKFLRDYLQSGYLHGINPNIHGMVESIVCSRALRFAGTYHSTYSGYIHRLRGYHGIGEESYYHSPNMLLELQLNRSVGQGWPREWRAGWTDDGGDLI